MIEIVIILLIILLTALWNGLVIQWYITKDQKYSKYWHGVGFVIRALLVAITFLVSSSWLMVAITAFASWIPYNMIINAVMGKPLLYVGKTAVIDRMIRRLLGMSLDQG